MLAQGVSPGDCDVPAGQSPGRAALGEAHGTRSLERFSLLHPEPRASARADLQTRAPLHRAVQAACLLLLLILPTGCGFSGGQALYMLGVGKGQKVEAKFRLTEGPVLILFDDLDRVNVPTFEMHLHDALAQELLRQKAAKKIIPYETVQHLRRTWPEFAEHGAREVGVKAQAEQVLWLEVQDFALSRESFDPERAAIITVSVKVINPNEIEDKSKVRLWPSIRAGHLITASLSTPEVTLCDNDQVLSRKLSLELADKIAKLFYDRRLEDTEQPEE